MIGTEVVIYKAALKFKSCFSDAKRVDNNGVVCNGTNKRKSLPKEVGQEVYFREIEIFIWDGKPNGDVNFRETKDTLQKT